MSEKKEEPFFWPAKGVTLNKDTGHLTVKLGDNAFVSLSKKYLAKAGISAKHEEKVNEIDQGFNKKKDSFALEL